MLKNAKDVLSRERSLGSKWVKTNLGKQTKPAIVYIHFKSCDQYLDKRPLISLTYFVPCKVVPRVQKET